MNKKRKRNIQLLDINLSSTNSQENQEHFINKIKLTVFIIREAVTEARGPRILIFHPVLVTVIQHKNPSSCCLRQGRELIRLYGRHDCMTQKSATQEK